MMNDSILLPDFNDFVLLGLLLPYWLLFHSSFTCYLASHSLTEGQVLDPFFLLCVSLPSASIHIHGLSHHLHDGDSYCGDCGSPPRCSLQIAGTRLPS